MENATSAKIGGEFMSWANNRFVRLSIPIMLPLALFRRDYVSVSLLLAMAIPMVLDIPNASATERFWEKRFLWYSVGNCITASFVISFSWIASLRPFRLAWAVIAGGYAFWSLMYLWERFTGKARAKVSNPPL